MQNYITARVNDVVAIEIEEKLESISKLNDKAIQVLENNDGQYASADNDLLSVGASF